MMMNEPFQKTVIYTGHCIKCDELISYEEGTASLKCLCCGVRFETKRIKDPSITIRRKPVPGIGPGETGINSKKEDPPLKSDDNPGEKTAGPHIIPLVPVDWKAVRQFAATATGVVGVSDKGQVVLSKSLVRKFAAKVQGWTDVCSVAFDGDTILALMKDGSVNIAKSRDDTDDRKTLYDLTVIVATPQLTVGVDKAGKIKAFLNKRRISNADAWSGVCTVAISEQNDMIALMKNGRANSVNCQGMPDICISSWENIVQVAAGNDFVVGLRKDGKVLSAARDSRRVPDTSVWKKIKSIAASKDFVVGLTDTGNVLSVAQDPRNAPDTSTWQGVQEIMVCNHVVIGVTSNGKRLQTCDIDSGG